MTINSYYPYLQDDGHMLSAFATIKKVLGCEFILFLAYFINIPLVVNSSDISAK